MHINKKLLKPILQKDGYLGVNLMKNGKRKRHRIHRLVAETFLSNKSFPILRLSQIISAIF